MLAAIGTETRRGGTDGHAMFVDARSEGALRQFAALASRRRGFSGNWDSFLAVSTKRFSLDLNRI